MRHYKIMEPHTFTDIVTVQMDGHRGRGYGAEFEVEVEFRAWPDSPASWDEPASAGDREIIQVRVIKYKISSTGHGVVRDGYEEMPAWLEQNILNCISVQELDADWSGVADAIAEACYQASR